MTTLNTLLKEIAWNGLSLVIPHQWEVIISGKNHLLFESDFQPVFELRWDSSSTQTTEKRIAKIVMKLQKELELPIAEVPFPSEWQDGLDGYAQTWLSWRVDKQVTGAVLLCKKCGTLLLLRFFHSGNAQKSSPVEMLTTFHCHNDKGHDTPWSIQDFKLLLPDPFKLLHYNIAAGFTRLSFSSPGAILHVCRIAPARERLKGQELQNILKTLLDTPDLEENVEILPNTVEYHSSPSIFSQIIVRLRRQKPFCWARIWHCEESDRLLAVIMESIRPINISTVHAICETYEILPSIR